MKRSIEKTGHHLMAGIERIFAFCSAQLRQRTAVRPQRLRVVERHALGPKQSLVLVEADGRSLLIATSHEASPVFFSLEIPPLAKDSERREEELVRRSSSDSIHLEPFAKSSTSSRSRRRVL